MAAQIGFILEKFRAFQAPCTICKTWNTPYRMELDTSLEHIECLYRCGMWDRAAGCGELYAWTDPDSDSLTEGNYDTRRTT